MPTLRELQNAFRAEVLAMQALPEAARATPFILEDGLGAPERLQIHRNHIYTTLSEALAGIYPAVQAMVGEAFFQAVANRFVAEAPPSEPMLYSYGDQFAAFLAGFGPATGLPYLPDLARLEWALHSSFHAPDEDALTSEALGAVPQDALSELNLFPHSSARLLRSKWPVAALWQAARAPDADIVAGVDLDAGGTDLFVLRAGGDVQFWALPAGEWIWLERCAAGEGLANAAAAATACDASFDLAAALTANLARGSFAPIRATGPESNVRVND